MPSNRYRVDYKVNGGAWTQASVNISYYGGTNSSPIFNDSGHSSETSMSFTNIPVASDALVQLRVTKQCPSVKGIPAFVDHDGTVQILTFTGDHFAGEQFVLWWDRGSEGAPSRPWPFS
jgi:hypothetical protein